jgi:uncharacterized protein YbjT (DUF2867 family)
MTASLYLVTGGSGFLGINLCRFLLSLGHRVRLLSYPERNAVEAIAGDVRDREAVDRAMDHAANPTSVGFDDVKTIAIVNQLLQPHVPAPRGGQRLRSRCHATIVNSLNDMVRTMNNSIDAMPTI